jgi:uncharacterized protein (DUF58 family)
MRSGAFRSLYRARGIEFSGVRDYLYGDDIRAIDWNVTARMGRPFVKLFEGERDLGVFLLVDGSPSMEDRLGTTLESAALLALAARHGSLAERAAHLRLRYRLVSLSNHGALGGYLISVSLRKHGDHD